MTNVHTDGQVVAKNARHRRERNMERIAIYVGRFRHMLSPTKIKPAWKEPTRFRRLGRISVDAAGQNSLILFTFTLALANS